MDRLIIARFWEFIQLRTESEKKDTKWLLQSENINLKSVNFNLFLQYSRISQTHNSQPWNSL